MFQEEFHGNRILQASLGVLAFVYFLVFSSWISRASITVQAIEKNFYQCPAYFQNCEWIYFLHALPVGYSQTLFYMGLLGVLGWVVYLLTERHWHEAQLLLIIPYVWHAANVFLITGYASGNYEYYIVVFATVVLFFPHKEFFAKLSLVLFYVMSTVAKLHPAWIAGSYFTNLQLGLPLFPDWSIPVFTNIVIVAEMVFAWFLMTKNRVWQRTALVFFIGFHLYSGILVEYRYPATVLPMLLVVFGPWYRYTPPPLKRDALLPWIFVILLFIIQLSPKLIYGDEKLTLEGNKYGLYMFESNHQCISEATIFFENGDSRDLTRVRTLARDRCEPYGFWFTLQNICEDSLVERIEWTFDHSINGDPFLRIVDTDNACALEYKPFSHNEWIKTHDDSPAVIGYPVKNYYH